MPRSCSYFDYVVALKCEIDETFSTLFFFRRVNLGLSGVNVLWIFGE